MMLNLPKSIPENMVDLNGSVVPLVTYNGKKMFYGIVLLTLKSGSFSVMLNLPMPIQAKMLDLNGSVWEP